MAANDALISKLLTASSQVERIADITVSHIPHYISNHTHKRKTE
jgi:hypothetical protein